MTALPDELSLGDELLADPARVAAVRRVLMGGTSAPGLDRLTQLAAELLDASHAQVSLIAEEQVVASVFGSEPTEDERIGPLAESLCTITVRLGAPFSVTDALADPRVRDLPPVTSGAVRSYLGVPLVASTGLTLGALCVYDARVRTWNPRDVGVLSALAESSIAELELRAMSAEMTTKATQLELTLSAADTGFFDWDLVADDLHWDDRLVELFDYDRGSFGGRIADFTARLHPDDRERVGEAMRRTIETAGDLSVEYRIVRSDGVRWVEARGRVTTDADGRAVRLLGVAHDSTEVREARDRVARVLESMTDAFYSVDADWSFTFVNAEAEKLLGRSADELLGRSLWEEFPAALGSEFEVRYRSAMESGRPTSFEAYYPPPLDGWYELRAWPGPDGLSVYFREVTGRKRAQSDREQAILEREQAYAAAESANARLSLLADASHVFAQSLEPEEVLQHLTDVLLPTLGSAVVVGLVGDSAGEVLRRDVPSDDQVHVVHVRHVKPELQPVLKRLASSVTRRTSDAFGVGAVVRTGEPEWLPAITTLPAREVDPDDPHVADDLKVIQPDSALTVPLASRGRRLGAVTVADPAANPVDRALIADLAARAAVALDTALLYRAERRTGLTLQRSLLPGAVPQLPGIEVAVRYRPGATGAFVGGDWYQGVVVGDDLVLCMGDVMGHGMRSAARMGQLRAIVATLALEGHGPGSLLTRLADTSESLLDLELATLLVAAYSPSRRSLVVASAGHPPPLLAALDRPPAYVEIEPGPPIGSVSGEYAETLVDVPEGATLVLYTDGLVEQRGETLESGLEALRQALEDLRLPPEDVADHVLETLGRSEGAADDVALLVLSHPPGS